MDRVRKMLRFEAESRSAAGCSAALSGLADEIRRIELHTGLIREALHAYAALLGINLCERSVDRGSAAALDKSVVVSLAPDCETLHVFRLLNRFVNSKELIHGTAVEGLSQVLNILVFITKL